MSPIAGIRLKFKLRKLSPEQRKRRWRRIGLAALFLTAIVLGVLFGTYYTIRQNLPSVSDLEHFRPYIISSVYSDSGEVIKEFAVNRRVEVPYSKIPDVLKKAILATEDPRFFSHGGIDFRGILRAVKENLRLGKRSRRLQGGSTITQQLATSLFLTREQTVRRKLKEMFLSLQIEKKYSKEKILEMYCNQFYLGEGAWGVETASQQFFGKTVSDLNLEEAALIAGIFRGPSIYSPYSAPEETLGRRNHVLRRMMEEKFITPVQEAEAVRKPLGVLPQRRASSDFGGYFFEEVRRYIEKTYGGDALYRQGLKIYTTLNPDYQRWAEKAVDAQLRVIDKRLGWRKVKRNVTTEGLEKPLEAWLDSWTSNGLEAGEIADAIVETASRTEATVRVKKYTGHITNKDIAWTHSRGLDALVKTGDVIQVKVKTLDADKLTFQGSLDQEPELEGAFLAIVPQTGQIKAMVGGLSFRRSEFNRATQALRQAGSAIKPILYTAALDNGYTPATRIPDERKKFLDKWSGKPWEPPNYDEKYKGTVTLRIGLEESRNVVTANILESITPQVGVDYCRKFGLTSTIYPYLSLALGSFEVSVEELVSAYTVFPNKGIRVKPYFITRIEDKDGNVLEEARVEAVQVISPQTAYLMTNILRGVVQRGTGVAASFLEKPLCGKTGTTNDFSDAWFLGFSPSLCVGVWVGNDQRVKIADRHSGAVAALPIWISFFKDLIEDEKAKAQAAGGDPVPVEEHYDVPPDIVFQDIDRKTGFLATPACLWPLREAFRAGTGPSRFCTIEDHMMILDYYSVDKASEEH
jgi:penicillin-binding protein 1A